MMVLVVNGRASRARWEVAAKGPPEDDEWK